VEPVVYRRTFVARRPAPDVACITGLGRSSPPTTERIELLAHNIARQGARGGELKREVTEAAANRVGGKFGTAERGARKWVDRTGRLYELRGEAPPLCSDQADVYN